MRIISIISLYIIALGLRIALDPTCDHMEMQSVEVCFFLVGPITWLFFLEAYPLPADAPAVSWVLGAAMAVLIYVIFGWVNMRLLDAVAVVLKLWQRARE